MLRLGCVKHQNVVDGIMSHGALTAIPRVTQYDCERKLQEV
jgi:hypothetical protein